MEKDKRLRDIALDLETFQAHIKRLKKQDQLHILDVELLQENTRKIYDKLISLAESLDAQAGKATSRTINLPEKMPEAEIPSAVESKKEEPSGTMVSRKSEPEPESIVEVGDTDEPAPPEAETGDTSDQPGQPSPDAAAEPDQEDQGVKAPADSTTEPEEQDQAKPSAFDLFSSAAGETIGDKLGVSDQHSIADRMQKSPLSDLKRAIGINEKFLFINELFNGDLGRYNKAIDEFNQLKSREGVDTHLVELKIQNQWDDELEAFQKLKALLDRKFI